MSWDFWHLPKTNEEQLNKTTLTFAVEKEKPVEITDIDVIAILDALKNPDDWTGMGDNRIKHKTGFTLTPSSTENIVRFTIDEIYREYCESPSKIIITAISEMISAKIVEKLKPIVKQNKKKKR